MDCAIIQDNTTGELHIATASQIETIYADDNFEMISEVFESEDQARAWLYGDTSDQRYNRPVSDFISDGYNLITDSLDVMWMHKHLDNQDYDSYFVLMNDSEYTEVWGMRGCIPYVNKRAFLVYI